MPESGTEVAYVANSYGDTVSVVDLATYEVIDTIAMDHGELHAVVQWPMLNELQLANTPMNPRFTHDRSELFVPNPEGCNIAVVDVRTNKVTRVIDLPMKPNDLEFTPDGRRAVVSLLGYATGKQGAVTVLDVESGTCTPPIMIGTQPEEINLVADGSRAYVVSKSLWVIDVDANEVANEIHLPYWCYDAVLSPDDTRLYLTATFGKDKIVIVDTQAGAVIGEIDVLMPACMVFTHGGERLLVSNVYNASLQSVDVRTGKAGDPSPVGPMPSYMALTADGTRAVLCYPGGDGVDVIDVDTLEVLASIPTGVGPSACTVGIVP